MKGPLLMESVDFGLFNTAEDFRQGATSMKSVTRFVGLDYHQESVQVCVIDDAGKMLANRSVENRWQAIVAVLEDTLGEGDEAVIVKASIESCSGAAHLAEELIERAGWAVTLAHPGLVNRMKQNPDKSDKTDAFVLADLMRLGYLPRVWLAPEEIRQLRSLVRFRAQKVKQQTQVKLRLRALLREHRLRAPEGMHAWTKAWFQWLKSLDLDETSAYLRGEYLAELAQLQEKIREVEKRLHKQTSGDAVVARLLTIEGIGPVTAITMRAEIARFERFDSGKQLARYCGVTPRNASSGQKQADAGLIKAGNPGLRIVLVQAAQRLMNFSPHWQAFSARLKKKGKPHNVIVAAVANRWLRWLYHQMQPEQLIVC
jgi:transposase